MHERFVVVDSLVAGAGRFHASSRQRNDVDQIGQAATTGFHGIDIQSPIHEFLARFFERTRGFDVRKDTPIGIRDAGSAESRILEAAQKLRAQSNSRMSESALTARMPSIAESSTAMQVAAYQAALPLLPDAKVASTVATILASHAQHGLIVERRTGRDPLALRGAAAVAASRAARGAPRGSARRPRASTRCARCPSIRDLDDLDRTGLSRAVELTDRQSARYERHRVQVGPVGPQLRFVEACGNGAFGTASKLALARSKAEKP